MPAARLILHKAALLINIIIIIINIKTLYSLTAATIRKPTCVDAVLVIVCEICSFHSKMSLELFKPG